MSSRLDAALRKLVEAGVPLEDLNPEVLSRDYGDPRFANRPMQPESRPYMGDWVPAVADKIGSGIGGAARWVDKNVPSMGGPVNAELLASLIQPLRGSDLGATGRHAGDVYPGAPKAASMVIGPAAAFVPKGYKAIKRLLGGADEVAFQPKLPGTARTETKKPEPEKPQEKTIDKLSRKARQEEALEKQGELPQSLDYELEVREISQEQYDDLLEEGWHYQEILDAHPRIPYSVRKEGREILGLESPVDSFLSRFSRTPKPAEDLLEAAGATGKGQCFPYCKRRAEEAIKSGENIKIVQGTYSMPKGARKPHEVDMPHVWVEKDNLIQDWQTMELPSGSHFAGKGIPKEMWDDPAIAPYLQEFVPHFEFTPEEWIKITDELGELGPFTVEEISRVLGK